MANLDRVSNSHCSNRLLGAISRAQVRVLGSSRSGASSTSNSRRGSSSWL